MILNFNKEEDNRWYIHLPSYTGCKEDLEMVLGADYLLDILSRNDDWVSLNVSLNKCNCRCVLDKYKEDSEGAWYFANIQETNQTIEIWLCNVTKEIFNNFPNTIYVK